MNDKKYTGFDKWIKENNGPDGSDMYSKMARKWAKKAWLAAKEKYEPRNCEWIYDEDTDSYDTQCGGKFQTIADSIDDNGIDFCCYCGGEIQDAPSTQGEE